MSDHETVVLITSNFVASRGSGSLAEDLVYALVDEGHQVSVLSMELGNYRNDLSRTESNPAIHRIGMPLRRIWKHFPRILLRLAVGWRASHYARRIAAVDPDRVVYFSPAFLASGPVKTLRYNRSKKPHVVLVQWDFFPIHNYEIGRIASKFPVGILRWIERRSISLADSVLVMSERNAEFLRSYHKGLDTNVSVQPPWGGPLLGGEVERIESDLFTVVFGGQLTKGRGVELILESAKVLEGHGSSIKFAIVGDGPDRAELSARADEWGLHSVEFLGRIPRERYLEVLARASVGLVVTVPGVSIPSFPSKSVDYCRAGLPILASVESTSDFGEIIEREAGGISLEAGNRDAMVVALQKLHDEWASGELEKRRVMAHRFYHTCLSSAIAVKSVLGAGGAR